MQHLPRAVLHSIVPTTRPRYVVTETDELAAALDHAAQRWPQLTRPQLLVRLALEGRRTMQDTAEAQRRQRLEVLRKHSGVLTGSYGADYLRDLREDWPS